MASLKSIKTRLTNILNEMNTIVNGNATTMSDIPQMVRDKIEENASSLLDYVVTFKDDSGDILAQYTVKNGIGNIAQPSGIAVRKWVDEDSNDVKFPINPISDMVVIATDKIRNSDRIYEAFGVDPSTHNVIIVYAYYDSKNYKYYTSTKLGTLSSNNITYSISLKNVWVYNIAGKPSDENNADIITNFICDNISSAKMIASGDSTTTISKPSNGTKYFAYGVSTDYTININS